MDRLIYLAGNGATNLMLRQDRIANNLANANSPGFRAETLAFRSVPTEDPVRVHAVESAAGSDFTPGPVQRTGRSLDVALQGTAWLAVQGPDGREAYTRQGNLQIGPEGALQLPGGRPVLGADGPIVVPSDAALTIAEDGTVSAVAGPQEGGAVLTLGRLKLVAPGTGELARGDDGLFRARSGALGADETAHLVPGALEGSNVNTVDALVGMISAARQFESQMKLIQVAEANDRAATQLLGISG